MVIRELNDEFGNNRTEVACSQKLSRMYKEERGIRYEMGDRVERWIKMKKKIGEPQRIC